MRRERTRHGSRSSRDCGQTHCRHKIQSSSDRSKYDDQKKLGRGCGSKPLDKTQRIPFRQGVFRGEGSRSKVRNPFRDNKNNARFWALRRISKKKEALERKMEGEKNEEKKKEEDDGERGPCPHEERERREAEREDRDDWLEEMKEVTSV